MQRMETEDIVAFLNTQTSVTNLVGNRIYTAYPKSEQGGNYIVIGEVTENIDTVDAFCRVEFRFIGKDDNTTWKELKTIERAVTNLIAQKGRIDFGSFKVNDVTLEANVFRGYDDKTRKIYLRDYVFYFLS